MPRRQWHAACWKLTSALDAIIRKTAAESTWSMEVWTLSVEADAAVLGGVLYANILAVATPIRPNGAPTKDFY